MEKILTSNITPGQREPESNGSEGVLHISKTPRLETQNRM